MPEVMSLFDSTDRNYQWRKLREIFPDEENCEDGNQDYADCKYQSLVATVKKRLDIIGFDLENTISDFENHKQANIDKFEDWSEDDDESEWHAMAEILKNVDISHFIEAFKEIFREHDHVLDYSKSNSNTSGLLKYILENEYTNYIFGFPCSDVRYFFRAFLEVVNEESLVVLDLSELVDMGCYEFDEDIVHLSHHELTSGYPINAKIIILCEGSSDIAFLERSMKLLYPDLHERYTFMDFSSAKAAGGAPALVQTIRSFIAAGIENRIIALFDNDTAAKSALRAIAGVQLPDHIKVASYPELEFLKSYPTIGPGGIQELDVNGLAGSIELYLGRECLEGDSGLHPVQWRGYDQSLSFYQGEVLNKKSIQNCFYQKLEACEKTPINISKYDWSGLHMIINCIFHCFGGIATNKTPKHNIKRISN